jgi:hypothetical protein
MKRLYFRGDPAFGNPEMYEYFETEGVGYAIVSYRLRSLRLAR